MPVWIRLSKLPMEWIDVDMLRNIGSILGNVCKVDSFTEAQSSGRFARICVELDITVPLKSSLIANKRTIKVEYESLRIICFSCGRLLVFREGFGYYGTVIKLGLKLWLAPNTPLLLLLLQTTAIGFSP
ncbi:hypothetical protein ACOSQ2_002916 [Xanthoceras sorbifolium]